jgi:hypothetical protein
MTFGNDGQAVPLDGRHFGLSWHDDRRPEAIEFWRVARRGRILLQPQVVAPSNAKSACREEFLIMNPDH